MYFEHLAKLINNSDSTYNLKVEPRKMSPMQYARRNAHRPVEKRKGNKKLPYIHVQDTEDYYSEFHRKKFYGIIDEMRKVNSGSPMNSAIPTIHLNRGCCSMWRT